MFVALLGLKKENRSLFSPPLPQFSKALSEVYFPKYDISDGGVFERVTKLSRDIYKQIIDDPCLIYRTALIFV